MQAKKEEKMFRNSLLENYGKEPPKEYSLERLIPEVVEVATEMGERYGKEIPVIAAGGIYSGEDIPEGKIQVFLSCR